MPSSRWPEDTARRTLLRASLAVGSAGLLAGLPRLATAAEV